MSSLSNAKYFKVQVREIGYLAYLECKDGWPVKQLEFCGQEIYWTSTEKMVDQSSSLPDKHISSFGKDHLEEISKSEFLDHWDKYVPR